MGQDPSVSESQGNRAQQKSLTREGFAHDKEMLANQQAYQKAMDELGRAKGAELMGAGEESLMKETESAAPELQKMMSDYAAENLLGQQENRKVVNLNLANQGVRGGQAATLANRASGDLNRGLSSDLNALAYDDAIKRRGERTKYAADKAAMGSAAYAR